MAVEISLSPEQKARIEALAARTGRNSADLVQEAVERLLDHDVWFIEQVERGLEQAARGELIDHDQVLDRIEKHTKGKFAVT